MTKYRLRVFSRVALRLVPLSLMAADVPSQLPKPDGKPADQTKPVKVFVMLGQSNMLGFGRVGPKETKGSLEYMATCLSFLAPLSAAELVYEGTSGHGKHVVFLAGDHEYRSEESLPALARISTTENGQGCLC